MKILSIDVGIVKMGICIIDTEEIIHEWKVLNVKGKNAEQTCMNLFIELNELPLEDVEMVLIEKQPRVNAKARVCEGYIISYFVLKNLTYDLKRVIRTFSAKYKLYCYKGKVPKFNVKSAYTIRKKTGAYHTQQMIKDTQKQEHIDFFNNTNESNGRFDISDAYLMAVAYIRFVFKKWNRPLPKEAMDEDGKPEIFLID
jgi:hypothetical protein